MEFKFRPRLIMTIVLLCISAAAQVVEESGQVRILVYDNARSSTSLLERAGVETTRIFRSAGIELVWINCTERVAGSACRTMARGKELMLRVVPKGKSVGDSVFGDAFLAADGSGRYADIFFDRIAATHRNYGVSESRILGAVAAHEIGHLLLGLGAHSTTGIMSPVWANDAIQLAEKGALLFTPEQARYMRKRVGRPELVINNPRLDRANTADAGERVSAQDTPFAFELATFLNSKGCTPTPSPCP
jgi:hypothetical protein